MEIKIVILYRNQSGCHILQTAPDIQDKDLWELCLKAIRGGLVKGIERSLSKRVFKRLKVDRSLVEEGIILIRSMTSFRLKKEPSFYCPFLHDRYFKTAKKREHLPENVHQIRDDLHYHL